MSRFRCHRRASRRLPYIVPVLGVFAVLSMLATPALAQEETAERPLEWRQGPETVPIGENLAELELSAWNMMLDKPETRRLLELTGNPASGSELATLAAEGEDWFVIFEWDEIGYVNDDERDELDPDGILESLRKGTDAANAERRKRGWSEIEIVGWHEEPHYDVGTNNLTWAIIGASGGHRTINRMIKILGRRGVMTATLVASEEDLENASTQVDSALNGYTFRSGSAYAEFNSSTDKLAEIGLTALIAGGAGVALVKSGLLARFWKLLVFGAVAVAGGFKRFFGRSHEQGPTV